MTNLHEVGRFSSRKESKHARPIGAEIGSRRNPFDGLLMSPARRPRHERIDILRQLAGRLQADRHVDVQWLGERLSTWLQRGGSLDAVLGVRAEQGSRATAQARVRQAETDGLLLQLAVAAGSDCKALAILRAECPCPASARLIVDRLQALKAPTSKTAISRARGRSSRHSK
ncbi:MAG: hypothetical protein JWR74_329 [Polaromonas sp.]|nr:hypothetical protein [Polaromonas sp.]